MILRSTIYVVDDGFKFEARTMQMGRFALAQRVERPLGLRIAWCLHIPNGWFIDLNLNALVKA